MKHNVISYSFVGIWATQLPGLPRLSSDFLANLFGDRFTTNVGLSPDGSLMVQRMMKPPAPTLMFGRSRFQVLCPTLDQMVRVLGAVIEAAHASTNQQIPLVAQVGLNTEHEWSKPIFKPASRWLAERYVRKGLFNPPLEVALETVTVNFLLMLSNPNRRYNVQLQPRAEVEDGVFAAINDHREWNQQVPSSAEAERLMKESATDIDTRVAPLLLGGVAENA